MGQILKILIAFICLNLLQGCATPVKPLPPSEFLLYTDRPQTDVLRDIRNRLKEDNYEIARFDFVTGIISTTPRLFSFNSKYGPAKGEQTIMVRQEAGSIKLRMQYRCLYPSVRAQAATSEEWAVCETGDQATLEKIEKLENIFLPAFAELLNKKTAGQEKQKQTLRSQVWRYR